MTTNARQRRCLILFAALGTGLMRVATAQTTGALYDPQPPADSAYLRVIVVSADGPLELLLDGKSRANKLMAATPSDYMVVKAGPHKLSLHNATKTAMAEVNVDAVAGRSFTIALPSLRADSKPQIFEDKANANKLKALVSFYHLAPGAGAVDTLTGDGNTKVFNAVAPGAVASLSVNPISVELQAVKSGDKTSLAKTTLNMAQGQSYSLVLLPGDGDKMVLKGGINTLERFTGR